MVEVCTQHWEATCVRESGFAPSSLSWIQPKADV